VQIQADFLKSQTAQSQTSSVADIPHLGEFELVFATEPDPSTGAATRSQATQGHSLIE
jgi:hypothetical protein